MAKNIDFMGAIFPDVPSVKLPQQGGGLVSFDDTTDATATADKILQGYTAYANGQKLVGTASGGITPSGTISITQNGQVDVTQYATADVNVSGGGGDSWTLLNQKTANLRTSSTSTRQLTGMPYPLEAWDAGLIIYLKIRDTAGARPSYFYSCDAFLINDAPNGTATTVNDWMWYTTRYNASGVRSVTKNTAYGIFPSITTKGSSSVNITINGRYNSSSSQTIDGTFSIEVYSIPFPNNDSPFA